MLKTSTNVVNAPREPFVVKQDHGSFVDKIICDLNKAPGSPHLHTFSPNQFHYFHCKDVLGDGKACQRCTYTSISANSLQNPPHIDECCYECGDALDGIFCQQCTCFDQTKNPQFPVIHPPPQETSIEILHDQENELAEYINSPGWNRPAFYDDDDDDVDYTIAITPVLSTKEPDNSLSMGDEHLDTILATESDEVIKSSVKDLVPIPSEFEVMMTLYYENIEYVEASPHDSKLISLEVAKIVIPEDKEIEDDNLCEKLLNVNLLIDKIKALKDNPTPSFEFLTKSSSTSPKSFLEETNTCDNSLPEFENFCFDLEEISSGSTTTHSDISLSKYDSFIFNLSKDQFPPTDRSNFTHEEFADELAHIISPPNYEAFSFYDDHIEEISSGSTTTHSDISLSKYDSFIFDLSKDQFPPTDRIT
nr:hypothetical protein [Tanacetum cinerariifolium]